MLLQNSTAGSLEHVQGMPRGKCCELLMVSMRCARDHMQAVEKPGRLALADLLSSCIRRWCKLLVLVARLSQGT